MFLIDIFVQDTILKMAFNISHDTFELIPQMQWLGNTGIHYLKKAYVDKFVIL